MPIKVGWRHASLVFWDFSQSNKHCIHFSTTKTIYFSPFVFAMSPFQKQSPGVVLYKKLPEACNFIRKETLALMFSYEFCEIFKNIFFSRKTLSGCFWHLHQSRFPILILHVIHQQLRREYV